jgi:small subunit ribosomal protein S14
MAKTSQRVRDEQRRVVVARYAERRAELTRLIASPSSSSQERGEAVAELQRQPRDASATRLRNRDSVDGRPRGYLRKAGVSRVRFRELAHAGQLPASPRAAGEARHPPRLRAGGVP